MVQRIIRNPAYKGEAFVNRTALATERGKSRKIYRPESEWVRLPDGTIPPIVDTATWDAAQARAARNSGEAMRRNRDPESFLLRAGYLLCGHCGRATVASTKTQRNCRRTPIYTVFAQPEQHADCPRVSITAAELDAAAVAYLKRVALNPDVIEWELTRLAGATEVGDADLEAVEARLATVKRKQRVLSGSVEALDDPEAAEPLLERPKVLAAEKRALEKEHEARAVRVTDQAATVARLRGLKERAAEIADNFDLLSYQSKRDILAAINLTARLYPADAPDRYTFESDADGLLHAIGYDTPRCATTSTIVWD